MARRTQRDVVLAYLLDAGRRGITQRECTRIGGGTRLAAIVFELREEGYNVMSELLDVENVLGGRSHPARYWLLPPIKGTGTRLPAPAGSLARFPASGERDALWGQPVEPAPRTPMRQMTLDGQDEDVT